MFTKATKSKAKLRAMFYGPSGAGKTYSALRVATGMGGTIAVIDTERGSASKYADRFVFDVCELTDRTIDGYCKAIASASSYNVLIIDSASHAWQELLGEVDRLTQTKFRGNSWAAWSEGTPKQRHFIDTLLNFPGHVIFTARADTEWSQERDEHSGKVKPVKIGLKPQQGKGIEYEADLLVQISPEHKAFVEKDRTGRFQDRTFTPDEEFGKQLSQWLSDGAEVIEAPKPPTPYERLDKLIVEHNTTDQTIMGWLAHFKVSKLSEISPENIERIIKRLESTQTAATAA